MTRSTCIHPRGHSREFGDAADSTLEEMVRTYVDKGFEWVGRVTEHIPPASADFLLPWEAEEGQTPESRMVRFTEYFSAARRLQGEYRDSILDIRRLRDRGLHGLRGARQQSAEAVSTRLHRWLGPSREGHMYRWSARVVCPWPWQRPGESMRCSASTSTSNTSWREELEPEVVGHFDLIRMHDKDYRQRSGDPRSSRSRIRRNLERIRDLGSILDFNLRALEKGGSEPYVSRSILEMALDLGVHCVPGDDSHGVRGCGLHLEKGIAILTQAGFSTDWQLPGNGTWMKRGGTRVYSDGKYLAARSGPSPFDPRPLR